LQFGSTSLRCLYPTLSSVGGIILQNIFFNKQ
jgi:hypothetical protein